MTPNYYQPYRISFTDPNSPGYVQAPTSMSHPILQSVGTGNMTQGAANLFDMLFGSQINAITNANPVQGTGFTPRYYTFPSPMPAANVSQPVQQYNMAGLMPYGLLGGGFGSGFGGTYGGMQFSPQTGTMQPIQATAPATK